MADKYLAPRIDVDLKGCSSIHRQLVENNDLLEEKLRQLQVCLTAVKKHDPQYVKQLELDVDRWKAFHLSATQMLARRGSIFEKEQEKWRLNSEEEKRKVDEELKSTLKKLDDEREQFEKLQKKFNEEQVKFKEERRRLEEALQRSEEEQSKLEQEVLTLKDQIRTAVRTRDLETEPKGLQNNVHQRLNNTLKDVEIIKSTNEMLRVELEGVKQENSTLLKNIQKLEQEVVNLKSEKGTLQMELEELQKHNLSIKEKEADLELCNKELQEKVEVMRVQQEVTAQNNLATTQALQSQLQLCGAKVEQLEAEVKKHKDENVVMYDEARMLKEQLTESEVSRQTIIRERESLKDGLKASNDKLIVADKQVKQVEALLRDSKEECTRLSTDLDTRNNMLQIALKDNEELQRQLDGAVQECTRKDERLKRLEKTRDELLEQHERTQITLMQYRKELKNSFGVEKASRGSK